MDWTSRHPFVSPTVPYNSLQPLRAPISHHVTYGSSAIPFCSPPPSSESICVCVSLFLSLYIYINMYVSIYLSLSLYIYIYISIYTYREKERERERERPAFEADAATVQADRVRPALQREVGISIL